MPGVKRLSVLATRKKLHLLYDSGTFQFPHGSADENGERSPPAPYPPLHSTSCRSFRQGILTRSLRGRQSSGFLLDTWNTGLSLLRQGYEGQTPYIVLPSTSTPLQVPHVRNPRA